MYALLINKPAYAKYGKKILQSHASKLEIETEYRILEMSVWLGCKIWSNVQENSVYSKLMTKHLLATGTHD